MKFEELKKSLNGKISKARSSRSLLLNAASPMTETLPGMVIRTNLEQFEKALVPNFVTPSGIVTLSSAVQPSNAQ